MIGTKHQWLLLGRVYLTSLFLHSFPETVLSLNDTPHLHFNVVSLLPVMMIVNIEILRGRRFDLYVLQQNQCMTCNALWCTNTARQECIASLVLIMFIYIYPISVELRSFPSQRLYRILSCNISQFIFHVFCSRHDCLFITLLRRRLPITNLISFFLVTY